MERKIKEEKACTSTTKQNTSPLNTADILLNAANSLSHKSADFEIERVRVAEKAFLTLDEARDYFNIGKDKLRQLTDEKDCTFVLFNGSKRLIHRKKMEEYLSNIYSI